MPLRATAIEESSLATLTPACHQVDGPCCAEETAGRMLGLIHEAVLLGEGMCHQPTGLFVTEQSIGLLKPYPRNARTHSKHQIQQIADSIKAFGFTNPILVNRENTIVAGHGRLQAAKLLGFDQVPTICLENLTEDQIRAYILADNKLAEAAN